MASERTAAQVGKVGEVRRDPMAMLPFCGYNMADYFRHWLEMGKRMTRPPKICHVNWFRMDAAGKFIWPGFTENLRVLEWIFERCNNKVGAEESPVGYIPRPYDIDMTGLQLPAGALNKLLAIDKKEWLGELKDIQTFFRQFKKSLPRELWEEYEAMLRRLKS